MTRQHFDAIAETIRRCSDCFNHTGAGHREFADAMAAVLVRFNPNFSRARFLRACDVECD
jgi:hypothetical protein